MVNFELDAFTTHEWYAGEGTGVGERFDYRPIGARDYGNGFGDDAFMRATDESNNSYNGEGYGHGYGYMSGDGICADGVDWLSLTTLCVVDDFIMWNVTVNLCE